MTQPRYPQQYALQNAQLLLVYACLRTDVFLVLQGGGRRRCSLADRLRTTNRDAGEPDVIHYYLTRPKQAPGTCKKHSLHLSSLYLPATTSSPSLYHQHHRPLLHSRQAYRFLPPINPALNNETPAFPNQSHARKNNTTADIPNEA
jgi:hypothetical protein